MTSIEYIIIYSMYTIFSKVDSTTVATISAIIAASSALFTAINAYVTAQQFADSKNQRDADFLYRALDNFFTLLEKFDSTFIELKEDGKILSFKKDLQKINNDPYYTVYRKLKSYRYYASKELWDNFEYFYTEIFQEHQGGKENYDTSKKEEIDVYNKFKSMMTQEQEGIYNKLQSRK